MDKISIENMYQDFLVRIKLPEHMMHPEQKRQTKNAFMAGISSVMIMMVKDFEEYTDDQCEQILGNIRQELEDFWKKVISDQLPMN